MTPKEKAEELYKRMYTQHSNIYPSTAKNCALIAVDEIINANPTSQLSDPFLGNRTYENVNYWKDVKQEIQNI
jgi:hypothetical protein